MEGCKQRGVAAAEQEAGAVGGGCQSNESSPNYPGNQLLCHPANWWSCSGGDGWRAGAEAGGWTVAAEREVSTESCPRVCLTFHFCLSLS